MSHVVVTAPDGPPELIRGPGTTDLALTFHVQRTNVTPKVELGPRLVGKDIAPLLTHDNADQGTHSRSEGGAPGESVKVMGRPAVT